MIINLNPRLFCFFMIIQPLLLAFFRINSYWLNSEKFFILIWCFQNFRAVLEHMEIHGINDGCDVTSLKVDNFDPSECNEDFSTPNVSEK